MRFCLHYLHVTINVHDTYIAMANNIELTEDDVEGAKVEEPLESTTVLVLKRCH